MDKFSAKNLTSGKEGVCPSLNTNKAQTDKYADANAELAALLLQCGQGNREAFRRLYELTSPKLTAITLAMVRDENLTFDILQQSYLTIWQKAECFDVSKGKAFTWLLVITRNKSLDQLRKIKRRGYTEELTDIYEDETMRSDDSTRAWMLRRLIAPCIDTLSPQATQAIILNVVHGLSFREIGESFGVPTNTVKSWVRRGLIKLRTELGIEDLSVLI